jgi:ABC-2 type transport system ATP-binding protein
VLTTHYLEEADALADRIAVIDTGRIVALGTPDELKASLSDVEVMVVEAMGVTEEALDALRGIYPDLRTFDGGIEITADEINVYDIGDCLRPFGVEIRSTARKQVSLDDVFIELTGKEMRE